MHMYLHLLDLWMCCIITSRSGKKAQYIYTHIMNICVYGHIYACKYNIYIHVYLHSLDYVFTFAAFVDVCFHYLPWG